MTMIDADKLKAIFEADEEPYELKWSSQAILIEIDNLIEESNPVDPED